jgi:nitrate reductase beta subunit
MSKTKKQIAWVVDLNKCIGCQTYSVACKVLWTHEDSEKAQWWCSVNTMPGLGTPRDWESMGDGYHESGKLNVSHIPTPEEFGGP